MWLPIFYTTDGKSVNETEEPLAEGHFVEMLNSTKAIIVNDEGRLREINSNQIRFPAGVRGPREHLVFENE